MPKQLLPFFISRKTLFIEILSMMFITGQCLPSSTDEYFKNYFDYKASSVAYDKSSDNSFFKPLLIEKDKSPLNNKHLSISSQNYSLQESDGPGRKSLNRRIRKRDEGEGESAIAESNSESPTNEDVPTPTKTNEGAVSQSQDQETSFAAEKSPPDAEESPSHSKESTMESIQLSTSNVDEPSTNVDMSFFTNQEATENQDEFQKKGSEFSRIKHKFRTQDRQEDDDEFTFTSESNWGEDSFYPPSMPHAWSDLKSRKVKPPQPVVSWDEFLVMQNKFQNSKLNPNLFPKNKQIYQSKDNLHKFIENALKQNKEIEKELIELRNMLQMTSEHKSSPHFNGIPRIINNTLQLNVPLQQNGNIMPQEFKIKIEAEAPLKIKTQLGNGKADAIRINNKPLHLGLRSPADSISNTSNQIQIREIKTKTKMSDTSESTSSSLGNSFSTLKYTTTEMPTGTEEYDPLKLERMAFIKKGAEFLRLAWHKYKRKRHPLLQ